MVPDLSYGFLKFIYKGRLSTMSSSKRQIHLGLFLQGAGHHASGWRHPDARSGSDNFSHLREVTFLAEQAKFDLVFLADGLTSGKRHHPSTAARLEPLTLLGALSTVTSLAATASTTYGDPFHLARAFASIDHLSNGRAAWNLVTTSYAARREDLTIRQLAQRVATSRGHHVLLGTAEEVADELQTWFESGAADGFNIMPAYFPGELVNFISLVIPILQERGLFRRDYEAETLRGHFGWPRIPSPYLKP